MFTAGLPVVQAGCAAELSCRFDRFVFETKGHDRIHKDHVKAPHGSFTMPCLFDSNGAKAMVPLVACNGSSLLWHTEATQIFETWHFETWFVSLQFWDPPFLFGEGFSFFSFWGFLSLVSPLGILSAGFRCVRPRTGKPFLAKRKRKRKTKTFRDLKRETLQWAARAAQLQTCVFACRTIRKVRCRRHKNDKKELQKIRWWISPMNQSYHRRDQVRYIVPTHQGLQETNGFEGPNDELKQVCRDISNLFEFATLLSGGANAAAATRKRREEQNQPLWLMH